MYTCILIIYFFKYPGTYSHGEAVVLFVEIDFWNYYLMWLAVNTAMDNFDI